MPVFFIPPACIAPPTISITGELLIHLRDSLRITIGETLWVGDGHRARYHVEITDISKHAVSGRILETIETPPRCTPRLILGQSLLKGDKMEWVIQKATELGVDELIPIESQHSVVQLKADRVEHQLTRWRRIALEAAQQSEQWRVPTMASPQSFTQLLASRTPGAVGFLLAERQDGKSLQVIDLPTDAAATVLVLIGPEGGWSTEEVRMAEQAGLVSTTLGQHILRAETAAIATISIVQSRLGLLG